MPNMRPVGCLGIPRYEDTPMGQRNQRHLYEYETPEKHNPELDYLVPSLIREKREKKDISIFWKDDNWKE